MKNKHIELVKKWLDDNDSVSAEELGESRRAAHINVIATYDAANEADTDVAWTDAWAAEYAFEAVDGASRAAEYAWATPQSTYAYIGNRANIEAAAEAYAEAAEVVNYWVAQYEELTNDK